MQRVLHTPWSEGDWALATSPGFACMALDARAAVARDDDSRTWLVFDGELDGRNRLFADLGR
jgi:hypothetical protein